MEEVIISISRTVISFFILMVVSLWVGKQVNSHKNHYNFALSITIGSFIANMGFDTKLKFMPMLAAFIALIFLYFFFSHISTRNRRLRMWISGQPTVVIENGKILDGNMKKIRYSLDDLNQHLRELSIFDIFEVEFALLEVSGKLSVLKKAKYHHITKKDLQLMTNQEIHFPIELIMDGGVIDKNFSTKYSNLWLTNELKLRGLQIKDIQYAVVSSNGTLFIDLFDDHLRSPLDKE